jgi:hypothetical protein
LRTVEFSPGEITVAGFERFGCGACRIVAFSPEGIAEDSVGEGEFLEFEGCGFFEVGWGFVC